MPVIALLALTAPVVALLLWQWYGGYLAGDGRSVASEPLPRAALPPPPPTIGCVGRKTLAAEGMRAGRRKVRPAA